MKLKQTISVDGTVRDNWTNSSDDIFAQLSLAGHAIHASRRDIPATWLQERTDLLFIMGCLFATGRVSIFSLEDKIRVDIRWEFKSQQSKALLASESQPVSESQQPAEAETALPEVFNAEYHTPSTDYIARFRELVKAKQTELGRSLTVAELDSLASELAQPFNPSQVDKTNPSNGPQI